MTEPERGAQPDIAARLSAYMERAIRARYGWTGHADDLTQVAHLAVAAELKEHGWLPERLLRRYALRRAWCDVRDELRRLRRQSSPLAEHPTAARRQAMETVSIRLTPGSVQALIEHAAARGLTVSAAARELLEHALNDDPTAGA